PRSTRPHQRRQLMAQHERDVIINQDAISVAASSRRPTRRATRRRFLALGAASSLVGAAFSGIAGMRLVAAQRTGDDRDDDDLDNDVDLDDDDFDTDVDRDDDDLDNDVDLDDDDLNDDRSHDHDRDDDD